jgi:hypothetical protein
LYLLSALKKPVILELRNIPEKNADNVNQFLASIDGIAQDIVVNDEYTGFRLSQILSKAKSSFHVIGKGIDFPKPTLTKKDARLHLNLENRFTVAVLTNEEDHVCMEKIKKTHQKFPDVQFILAGKYNHGIGNEREKSMMTGTSVLFDKHLQAADALWCFDGESEKLLTHAKAMNCELIVDTANNSSPMTDFLMNMQKAAFIACHAAGQNDSGSEEAYNKNRLAGDCRYYGLAYWNIALRYVSIFRKYLDPVERIVFSSPDADIMSLSQSITKFGLKNNTLAMDSRDNRRYYLPDQAKALVAASQIHASDECGESLEIINAALDYIENYTEANKPFSCFMDASSGSFEFLSHDHEGDVSQIIWSLGWVCSLNQLLPQDIGMRSERLMQKYVQKVHLLQDLKSVAVSIQGLYLYNIQKNCWNTTCLIQFLAEQLIDHYPEKDAGGQDPFKWYRQYVSFACNHLPEALIYAYLSSKEKRFRELARETFDFLLKNIFSHGMVRLKSSAHWFLLEQGEPYTPEYGKDICSLMQTLSVFYEVFSDRVYLDRAEEAFSWFMGNNICGLSVFEPVSGSCFEGVTAGGLIASMTPESLSSYIISKEIIEKMRRMKSLAEVNAEPFKMSPGKAVRNWFG